MKIVYYKFTKDYSVMFDKQNDINALDCEILNSLCQLNDPPYIFIDQTAMENLMIRQTIKEDLLYTKEIMNYIKN